MHGSDCLRGVMKIGEMEKEEGPKIEVVSQTKISGGVLKKVTHYSECN